MSISRRTFLATLTAAAAGAAVAAPKKKKLSILILDGIGPLAPYQSRYALARGHSVTVFARGKRDEELPKAAEYLDASRNGDYAPLAGRTFDVVIDNAAASQPRWVLGAEPHVRTTKQYIFLSDEIGEAEETVRKLFPKNATIVRAAALAGAGDKTDRFTYWAVRVASGGEVLAPGSPSTHSAFIDVRDLGEWMIRLAESRTFGTFDAVAKLTMGELLEGIRTATSSNATFTWVTPEFLDAHAARLPVWTTHAFDPASAIRAGLTYRALADSVEETLTWHLSRDAMRQASLRAGIARERETELLARWKRENR
ncbi:MAG TPA: twin-arginine translocation signal domain-containing protein [Thermoanaerobaculia bacterium]|nr:twin-arginine translocation signal domain-containing protein [Thermoanaerobaculia bacterium]